MRKNVKNIFGKSALEFTNKKIKPTHGMGRIPDIYVVDVTLMKLYVVEIERSCHSLPDHIVPQISGFNRTLSDISARSDLVGKFYSSIIGNTDIRNEFKNRGIDEIHKFLTDVLNTSYEVVVIIDKITEDLKKGLNLVNPIPKILEFKRFKKTNGDTLIYVMDTLDKDFANTDSIFTDNIDKDLPMLGRSNITSMIPPGDHIYMKYHGKTYVATIESGGIRLEDNSIEPTLLTATKKITGWKAANVWKIWFLDRECTKSIDRLRSGK